MSSLGSLADLLACAETSEALVAALDATEASPPSSSMKRSVTFGAGTFAWVDVVQFGIGESAIVEIEFEDAARPDLAALDDEFGPTIGFVDGDEPMRSVKVARPDSPRYVRVSFVAPRGVDGRVSRVSLVR